jgi:hypothetical protein
VADIAPHRNHQRCSQSGAGRGAEQVWVDERVTEHALVRGAPDRQHGAHDPGQDHAWHADVPDQRPLRLRHAGVDVDARQVIEERERHAPCRRPGGADHRAEQHGGHHDPD